MRQSNRNKNIHFDFITVVQIRSIFAVNLRMEYNQIIYTDTITMAYTN